MMGRTQEFVLTALIIPPKYDLRSIIEGKWFEVGIQPIKRKRLLTEPFSPKLKHIKPSLVAHHPDVKVMGYGGGH
jgi:hypothetical protein